MAWMPRRFRRATLVGLVLGCVVATPAAHAAPTQTLTQGDVTASGTDEPYEGQTSGNTWTGRWTTQFTPSQVEHGAQVEIRTTLQYSERWERGSCAFLHSGDYAITNFSMVPVQGSRSMFSPGTGNIYTDFVLIKGTGQVQQVVTHVGQDENGTCTGVDISQSLVFSFNTASQAELGGENPYSACYQARHDGHPPSRLTRAPGVHEGAVGSISTLVLAGGDCTLSPQTGPGEEEPETRYRLAVDRILIGGGLGRVTGSGINCPDDCTHSYLEGNSVLLEAKPQDGMKFGGWVSSAPIDCGPEAFVERHCLVPMDRNREVRAVFVRHWDTEISDELKRLVGGLADELAYVGNPEMETTFLCLRRPALAGCRAVARAGIGLALQQAGTHVYARVAGATEPPDHDYKRIARASIGRVPARYRGRGTTARLVRNGARIRALAVAMVQCVERSQGAEVAADGAWVARQRECAVTYARRLTAELRRGRALRQRAAREISGTAAGRFAVTKRTARRARELLQKKGFPKPVEKLMKRVAFASGERADLRQNLLDHMEFYGRTSFGKLITRRPVVRALRSAQTAAGRMARDFAG